jgi:hypothetical protein
MDVSRAVQELSRGDKPISVSQSSLLVLPSAFSDDFYRKISFSGDCVVSAISYRKIRGFHGGDDNGDVLLGLKLRTQALH